MSSPPGTVWPSETQELLLVAALADGSAAVGAWMDVRPRLSIDELELGSFALLPLIYRNLSAAGHDDVDLPRLKGIYRRTWVRNNLLVERTAATAGALLESGIRAEFIEGVVLASRVYGELGLRPTSFVDVLVEELDLSGALAAVARAGWTERPGRAPSRGARYVFDREGNACILRTVLAADSPRTAGAGAVAFLWETGEPHSLGGVAVPVPPPAETLLATCATHARVDARRSVQWVVDAKMLLRAGVDWEGLFALARESGQVARLRDVLGLLARLPGSRPPREVCDRFLAAEVSRRERVAYLCTVGAVRGPGSLPMLVGEHLAATADRSALGVVATFPGFLRDRWGLALTWHVPFAAGKRAVRRLAHRRSAA
jgi:hypothetical protein